MSKELLYPHVPKSRMTVTPGVPSPGQEVRLRYLPDSPEILAETLKCTGCRENLCRVFQQAIARVQGGR